MLMWTVSTVDHDGTEESTSLDDFARLIARSPLELDFDGAAPSFLFAKARRDDVSVHIKPSPASAEHLRLKPGRFYQVHFLVILGIFVVPAPLA